MAITLHTIPVTAYSPLYTEKQHTEISMDLVVPDTYPDIDGILSAGGTPILRSKDTDPGMVTAAGVFAADVLYRAEETGTIYALHPELPFKCTAENADIQENCLPVVRIVPVSAEAKLLNPRKIALKVTLCAQFQCWQIRTQSFPTHPAGEQEGLHLRTDTAQFSAVTDVREKTFVVTDTYPVRMDEEAEMLQREVSVRIEDTKTMGNKLIFKGSIYMRILHSADEGCGVCEEQYTTGFSQIIEMDLPADSSVCQVTVMPTGLYPELLREGGLSVEYHLVAQVTAMSAMEVPYMRDCYSNRTELAVTRESRAMTRFERVLELRETLRKTLKLPEDAEAIRRCAVQITDCRSEEGILSVELQAQILYANLSGRICAAQQKLKMEIPNGLESGMACTVLDAYPDDVYAALSAEGVELRIPVELRLLVQSDAVFDMITDLEWGEKIGNGDAQPALTVLFCGKAQSDLWEIAKRHHSTQELIEAANAPIDCARVLLIPREI